MNVLQTLHTLSPVFKLPGTTKVYPDVVTNLQASGNRTGITSWSWAILDPENHGDVISHGVTVTRWGARMSMADTLRSIRREDRRRNKI